MDLAFLQDPRYQNAILKMSRLGPYESAAIDTAIADRSFANKDMQRRLLLLQMGARQRAQGRQHEMGGRRVKHADRMRGERYDLRKDQSDFDYQNLKIGTGIQAVGSAADIYAGHRKKMANTKMATSLAKHRLRRA